MSTGGSSIVAQVASRRRVGLTGNRGPARQQSANFSNI
jgi:hypothetical protein